MMAEFFQQLLSHVDGFTILVFIIATYLSWKYFKTYKMPPGPWGLPIIGYMPFMGSGPPEETFIHLSKKYGKIMSLQLGSIQIVVLNNFEAMKEAFVKQGYVFMARPSGLFVKLQEKDTGILASDGDLWKEHRRFTLSTLRDYGMGKASLEPLAMEEIHCFLDELAKQNGKPFNPIDVLGMSTANIISSLEFGKRFEYNDEAFLRLRKLLTELMDIGLEAAVRSFFPWLEYIPFSDKITHSKRIIEISDNMTEFLKQLADDHKAVFVENSKKDYVDAYLTERNEIVKKTGNEGYFDDNELIGNLETLFVAGTETIATTVRWAFLLMLAYPDMQKRVQKEIDEVIGMERDPSFSDKTRMVFTEAVLLEVQRYGSIAALNIPHSNYEEIYLYGYRIPKHTVIFSNLYAVHRDPTLWEKPDQFMPERFIKDGKLEKPEFLIPFGIGRRLCLGESLARMELFLYFTSVLQRFNLQTPEGVTADIDAEHTTGRRPKPYEFCAIQREGYNVH